MHDMNPRLCRWGRLVHVFEIRLHPVEVVGLIHTQRIARHLHTHYVDSFAGLRQAKPQGIHQEWPHAISQWLAIQFIVPFHLLQSVQACVQISRPEVFNISPPWCDFYSSIVNTKCRIILARGSIDLRNILQQKHYGSRGSNYFHTSFERVHGCHNLARHFS